MNFLSKSIGLSQENKTELFSAYMANASASWLIDAMLSFNTSASGWFWRFSQKNQQFSVALPTP